MVNPRVTQNNIQTAVCRRGWTRTVHPSRNVTDAIKRNLVADRRVSPRDYELDHIVPLDLGGAPRSPQSDAPVAGRRVRCPHVRTILSANSCAGDLTLKGAQHEIATDWRAGYKKWINGKGCGDQ